MAHNLLIVDDSSVTRSVIKKAVLMSGAEVGEIWQAQDGVEALTILNDHAVDVVFSDLNMPRMGGLDLVKRMAELPTTQSIPVVIISSNRVGEEVDRLKEQGVRAYLTKPFRPEEILAIMQGLVASEGENAHVQ